MALAYLLDPTKQYQNRAGVNNVSGWLEVFRMDTDTRATVYSDFAGTVAPAHIGIDNNGRAVMIVESGIAYRVEMYGPDGDLIFTQQPIYTQASGGGIGSLTRVESTDGSVGVEASTVGSVVTYDLSVANDGSDLLEFVRCDGAERIQNTDIFRPTYTDGTMAIGNQGILLGEGRYYHITAHIRASKNQQREPFYDRIFIGVQTNDGTTTTPITRTSEIIDYSLGLTQDFEFSTDVYAQADCELELFVTGQDVLGGDIEVLDIEAHRIFSGSPAIPSGVLSRAQAANIYQRQLIAGANITIEETEEGDVISAVGGGGGGGATYQGGEGIVVNNTTYRISIDDSVVQEKLTAGDNITIDENNVISATVPSVDISGKADKVEDAVNGNLAGLDANGNLTDSGIAADRVVQDANYVHTDQNFTTELKNKLVNIEAGAEVNVQSDWTEENSSSDAYIRNKPDLSQYASPEDIEQLEQDISGKADKVSGATAGNLAGLDSTGNLTDSGISASDVATQTDLAGKQDTLIAGDNITIVGNVISSTGGGSFTQVQSNWNETDPSAVSYIQNKPTIPSEADVVLDANSTWNDFLTAYNAGKRTVYYSMGSGPVGFYHLETVLITEPQSNSYATFVIEDLTASTPEFFTVTLKGDNQRVNTVRYLESVQAGTGLTKTTNSPGSSSNPILSVTNPLPSSSAQDANKVLTVDSTGSAQWSNATSVAPVQDVTVGGTSVVSGGTAAIPAQVQSDWIETDISEVSYIQHKPETKPLVAGSGISITENAATVTIAATGGGGGGGATYTAGNGINIDANNEISVDTSVVATQSDLASYTPTASLATVATTGAYSDLSGTPTIPAAQVQSNWNESDSSSKAYIQNKPNLAAVATSGAYSDLSGTPTIPAAQVQSNWNESDSSSKAYILNKPTIPTVDQTYDASSANAQSGVAVASAISTALGPVETALANL